MRKLFFCLMAMMGVLTLSAQCELGSGMSVYDFTVKDEAGKDEYRNAMNRQTR